MVLIESVISHLDATRYKVVSNNHYKTQGKHRQVWSQLSENVKLESTKMTGLDDKLLLMDFNRKVANLPCRMLVILRDSRRGAHLR